MTGFLLRMLVTALGLWLASSIVDGIHVRGPGTLLVAAALLGPINAVIRPLVVLVTIPVTLLSLGLFLLVINGAMLGLVALLLPGLRIDGLLAAIAGAIIIGLTSWCASWFIGPRGTLEVLGTRRDRS